jgi:hypothetical protein
MIHISNVRHDNMMEREKASIKILRTVLSNALALLLVTACTHTMDMSKCKELFAEFPVDPVVAQRHVPASYNVRIGDNDKATLLLMIQDCEMGVLDQIIPIKPLQMSHIWIEIQGPEEIGPILPGTNKSLPTAYYYILPHQVESKLAYVSLALAGIGSQLVDEISIGHRINDQRRGRVFENGPSVGYQWVETSHLLPNQGLVTGRRKFYRQYESQTMWTSSGTVSTWANFLGEGKVVLTASPDSSIGRLGFGITLEGIAQPVEMDCHAEIKVQSR